MRGPDGSIRNKEEYMHGANSGLEVAIDLCEEVKDKHPEVTYADLYQVTEQSAMFEVLGLQFRNMSSVITTATAQMKLVYKQGQPGITNATVSVVFDKSDRSRSPLGYENRPETTVTRRIVVGGRNKYLINGHLAQPSQVQNLFHSVQLNVNNPHFLIMHGRITCLFNYADCLSIRR